MPIRRIIGAVRKARKAKRGSAIGRTLKSSFKSVGSKRVKMAKNIKGKISAGRKRVGAAGKRVAAAARKRPRTAIGIGVGAAGAAGYAAGRRRRRR